MSDCRFCGSPIGWRRVEAKWRPTNPDGGYHLCRGSRRSVGAKHIAAPAISGDRYTPSCGECGSPPWEFCGCSARIAPRKETAAEADTQAAEIAETGLCEPDDTPIGARGTSG